MNLKLYNYFRSSASYRVRIALALKGLEYDYMPVSLLKNEQFAESYAAVSASRLVLVLQIFNAQRMDCRLDHVPTVMRVFGECMKLDAFAKTQPSACPDAS